MRLGTWTRRLAADEQGATAIEYALIVGMMSLVVVAIAATGGALTAVYEKVDKVSTAIGGGAGGGGSGGDGGG